MGRKFECLPFKNEDEAHIYLVCVNHIVIFLYGSTLQGFEQVICVYDLRYCLSA